jgi:hypothetical protein
MDILDVESFSKGLIFIDTNIFLYAFNKKHRFYESSLRFLSKCQDGETLGFSSVNCINEFFYKVTISELEEITGMNKTELLPYIKREPTLISKCHFAQRAIEDILKSRIVLLPFTTEILKTALDISNKYNLLASDAIHAASCKYYDIKNIATNDSDFERVDFLKVWKP